MKGYGLFVLILGFIVFAMLGCGKNDHMSMDSQDDSGAEMPRETGTGGASGQAQYERICKMCHESDGMMGSMNMGDNVKIVADAVSNGYVKSLAGSKDNLGGFIQEHAPMTDEGGKTELKLTVSESQVLAAYIWSGKGEAVQIQPISVTGSHAEAGGPLFQKYCADCHGEAGDSGVKLLLPEHNLLIKKLSADAGRLAGFIKAFGPMTKDGRKDPKVTLTDEESQALAAYIWAVR